MRLPDFEYVKPDSLKMVLDTLHDHGKNARILAGGTDLVTNMKYRVVSPKAVISTKSVPDLRTISSDSEGVTNIGALVTLSELSANTVIARNFPAFSHAVKSVASKHVRNMASIGGNICLDTRCWYYNQSEQWRAAREKCHKTGGQVCHAIKGSKRCHAINSSDTVPVLLAMDARIRVEKKGHVRTIPLMEFFKDNGAQPNVLESDEMLTALSIPGQNNESYSAFIKIVTRKGVDFSEGSIAGKIQKNGKDIVSVKLILGSMASAPIILTKTSGIILDSGLTENAILKAAETARTEMGTLTSLFTSAGHKRHLAGVLVKRLLLDLKNSAK